MADIKWNDGKIVFGDDGFEVNSGTPEEYSKIGHDETDALKTISAGSAKTIHIAPTILADDGYIDLPAETSGRGFILIGDAEQWVDFEWESDNTVALIDYSSATYIDDADTDTKFCMFDNTDSVRIKNRLGAAKRIMFDGVYTENILAPMFQIFKVPSGVDNLDPNLTINGVTVTPTFRYFGGDANATNWVAAGYGETLTRVAVVTPPTYNDGSPGLGSNDDSCKFNGSDYYNDTAAANQFTTGDIALEIVFKRTALVSTFFVNAGATNGFNLRIEGSRLRVTITDDDGSVTTYSQVLTANCWYHGMVFINRDEASTNGGWIYVNTVAGGAGANFSAVEKTLTAPAFQIGSGNAGANPTNSNIAYIAAWEQASWHKAGAAGPAEWALIAKERFQKFCGIYPEIAHNSANLLVDGDMEAVGVADWTARGNGSLSKETSSPYSGTRNLRITYVDTTYYGASQTCLTAGHKYRITGYMRGDGTNAPQVAQYPSGFTLVQGTSSTSWQEFDVYFTALGSSIVLRVNIGAAGYVEYDDVTVTCLGYVPITATRAFNAYVDKLEGSYRKLYYVGSEWLRMCKRQDSLGENVFGYLPETAATNKIVESEDFLTTWTLNDAGDTVLNDQAICPDGRIKATSFGADSTDSWHRLGIDATLTGDTYTFSCFVKPGNSDWVQLLNTTVANCYCYFNVTTGAIGTAGVGATGYIEGPFYSGDDSPFYRPCIVFTGTAATHALKLYISNSDTDNTFSTGNGSPSLYLWGAQCELGDYMTSPIRTDGSALTRPKDNLQFVAGENIGGEDVGQGSIYADVLLPDFATTSNYCMVSLSDGGSSLDRFVLYASLGASSPYCLSAASGGNAGLSTITADGTDNTKHTLGGLWETDNLIAVRDGVPDATPDTTCDMPDDLDRIVIGQTGGSVFQIKGLIQNLRIYNIPMTKGAKG